MSDILSFRPKIIREVASGDSPSSPSIWAWSSGSIVWVSSARA